MKTIQTWLTMIALLLCSITMSAQTFQVDGLRYTVLSSTDMTVSVQQGSATPSGELIIPTTVTYEGTTYDVISIGSSAFSGCTNLVSVTIPDSVTHIGVNAFEGCTGLAQEDGVTYVGNWIVACDESVSEVVCREGTIGIANGAFEDCFHMKAITIPTSLDIIGDNAFCPYRIKDIYYAGSEKRWRRIRIGQFNNSLSDATFHYNYVP